MRVVPNLRSVANVALDECLSRRELCQLLIWKTLQVFLHDGFALRRSKLLPVLVSILSHCRTEAWCDTNHDDMRHILGILLGVLECHECVPGVANDGDAAQPELLPSPLEVIEQRVQGKRHCFHWAG